MKTMTTTTSMRLSSAVGLALLLGVITWTSYMPDAQAGSQNPNPGIIPPNANYGGHSYGEWGAQFWKTLFAIPVVDGDHPYLSGGALDAGQGMVFLTASGNGATFNVTIEPGSALFFPIINAECSVLEPEPFHGDDEAELRACANHHIDHTSGLLATIDGVPVSNLAAYRFESPLFEFALPEDNLFAFFGLDAPAGTTSPAVDAGYYLLLKPLPPGLHTIHIESAFDELGVTFNNTFNITVE
jgi:hypothetical protein